MADTRTVRRGIQTIIPTFVRTLSSLWVAARDDYCHYHHVIGNKAITLEAISMQHGRELGKLTASAKRTDTTQFCNAPMFRRNILPPSSESKSKACKQPKRKQILPATYFLLVTCLSIKMEAECHPETLVNLLVYRIISRYIQEESKYSCVVYFSRLHRSLWLQVTLYICYRISYEEVLNSTVLYPYPSHTVFWECTLSHWPPLWSSVQSSWLQIQRSGFDSRRYQIFWELVVLERGPLSLMRKTEELLGRKSSGSGLESREYGRRDPYRWPRDTVYPQKLVLTSPTSGGRSVGIVRPRTKATELFICCQ
jgi:hypothetical protein